MERMASEIITSEAELEALYGAVDENSTAKEVCVITPHYRQLIEASPFAILATSGPEGLDASPRGDVDGAAIVRDERTLLLPDRRGNNRIDSLRNVVRDPRVALLFLIPGSGTTLRVNGRAAIHADPQLLASFVKDGAVPRSLLVVSVEAVYFQCARAVIRSRLWDPQRHVDPAALPTVGAMLAALRDASIDAAAYDAQWPDRAARSLW
jgi:uncharacterized protein